MERNDRNDSERDYRYRDYRAQSYRDWDEIERQRMARRAAIRRKKRRQARIRLLLAVIVGVALVVILLAVSLTRGNSSMEMESKSGGIFQSLFSGNHPALREEEWITQDLLTVNEYSRPGTELKNVDGIVVHYVGNAGTTAQQNRNYFESLSTTGETSASSHFVIGLEGEIIQCVPLNEIAYASNDRNADTISIECCHPGEDGQFSDATYRSLIRLLRLLCDEYNLKADDIIRHYDVTGKECPIYYVKNPDAWEKLKADVFDKSYIVD